MVLNLLIGRREFCPSASRCRHTSSLTLEQSAVLGEHWTSSLGYQSGCPRRSSGHGLESFTLEDIRIIYGVLTVVENVEILVSLTIDRSALQSLGGLQSVSSHATRMFLGSRPATSDCYVVREVWRDHSFTPNQLSGQSVPSDVSNWNLRVLSDLQPLSVYCQPIDGILVRPFSTLLIQPLFDLGLDPTIQDPRPATRIAKAAPLIKMLFEIMPWSLINLVQIR